MPHHVIIIGCGMGGLTAAVRLAQRGCQVTVLEARDNAGGLAAGIEIEGMRFDSGPYVLLDRPGLEWAFAQLGMTLTDRLRLNRISDVYEIESEDEPTIRIFDSLDRTADGIESQWPGCGDRYRSYIHRMTTTYIRLQPLQWISRPGLGSVLRTGAWRELPFILRSLKSVLNSAQLPDTVTKALGIWTHVAGQTTANAPSPLAMVPAVIHAIGAYYPVSGIGSVPTLLFERATELGVRFRFAARVKQIRCESSVAVGVDMEDGDFHPADVLVSNVGIGTYLHLLDGAGVSAMPARMSDKLAKLPLQSPGVCAYLAVKGKPEPPYLRFRLRDEPDGCRLLITPGSIAPEVTQGGWAPARLIAPMHHDRAELGGETRQQEFLGRVLAETWWREQFEEVRVLTTRIPREWGSTFHLFRNSMNPVMTAAFMRAGRLAHRSPWIRRLYLTGSATHPGQWISFCAVSGVLTANRVLHDLGG